MLKFRNVSLIFIILLVFLVVIEQFYAVPLFSFLILCLVYFSFLVYGSSVISSNFYLNVLCRGNGTAKQVAITFDDGPVGKSTETILEILNQFHAEAAFFGVGKKILENKELLVKIDLMNHIIGNHTYSHANYFNLLSFKKTENELLKTENIIFSLTKKKVKLFRPPFGVTNPTLKRVVESLDYSVIGWSVRSFDTTLKVKERILNRITKKIKPGTVILLHETAPRVLEVLKDLLLYLHENGYEVVRLDKLLAVSAYKNIGE